MQLIRHFFRRKITEVSTAFNFFSENELRKLRAHICLNKFFLMQFRTKLLNESQTKPELSGPKAQIDLAANKSQSYLVWKNSPNLFLFHPI